MTRRKTAVGALVGIVALLTLLSLTGPNPETEFTGNIRRRGGPCLQLEQWGLFGWAVVGQTSTMTQATSGAWQEPSSDPSCQDVDDSLVLIRMPRNASPDSYRICGLADDRACLTIELVPFISDGPGP